MKVNYNLIIILSLLVNVFLVGCQQQVQQDEEARNIEIIDETPVDVVIEKDIEEEFDDGLDAALQELEEIENI